jgi:hypothetical protein
MADEHHKPLLDLQPDLRTDYILIAAGIGAALLALLYLLLV